jgi:hypothetical protein
MKKLIQKFKLWRKRRFWQKRQLEFLRTMIIEDHQWLAANPIANALTTRYMNALSEDWYKKSYPRRFEFRREIGLDPFLQRIGLTTPKKPELDFDFHRSRLS